MKLINMKLILLVGTLFLSVLSYAQNDDPNTIIGKGSPMHKKTVIQPENTNQTFDGTFYIITDEDAPERFTNEIFSVVKESRKEDKDVKVKIGDRSTIVIFSEKKINKENFVPVKEMILLK